MKASHILKLILCLCITFSCSLDLMAQDDQYQKTIQDIESTFGIVPQFFKEFPKIALPGAWESFKALNGPETAISAKNKELIGLGVAAQIPCTYCVYFHTAVAKANGATDEEIQEAIAIAANTRHWSTVLNGAQIDFEKFKMEFKAMMDFMAEKSKSQ
jgi:AhpD family alkylhydroperoxidase